jgi:hypothetical protein
VLLGERVQRAARARQSAGGHREPRDEAQVFPLGVLQDVLGTAVGQVVQVLHGDDVRDLPGFLDLLHGHLGQADVADLALLLQQEQLTDLVGQRDLGVDAVQLVEVDPLHAQVAQAQFGLLPQVLGAAERAPVVRARAGEPALGGDHQVLGVRVQGLADELLADERAVGVGGVDEVHAQLGGPAQHAHGLLGVLGVAPHSGARQLHRAVAEPVDGQVAAEAVDPGGVGGTCGFLCHGLRSRLVRRRWPRTVRPVRVPTRLGSVRTHLAEALLALLVVLRDMGHGVRPERESWWWCLERTVPAQLSDVCGCGTARSARGRRWR